MGATVVVGAAVVVGDAVVVGGTGVGGTGVGGAGVGHVGIIQQSVMGCSSAPGQSRKTTFLNGATVYTSFPCSASLLLKVQARKLALAFLSLYTAPPPG